MKISLHDQAVHAGGGGETKDLWKEFHWDVKSSMDVIIGKITWSLSFIAQGPRAFSNPAQGLSI